ncbi:MAG: hypothetical protein QF363_06270 [Planctomycetaceae bacterium]|jgi:hypothetical protein|nr:hypothetical protein [Planctomycetaceae bacterium]
MRRTKAGWLSRSWIGVAALVIALGVAGCSCHKSTCYDGDCGLVYDDDYFGPDCGGGHNGCSHPPAHAAGCATPHESHGCGSCATPHRSTCSSCGGVHHEPAPPVEQPGCPHCGQRHGPPATGAPPAEPIPMSTDAATTKDPPPPPLPPAVPADPAPKKLEPVKPPAKPPAKPAAAVAPSPLTGPADGVQPAPPSEPVRVPLPVLEKPAPIPRDASNTESGQPVPEPLRWIPRRI